MSDGKFGDETAVSVDAGRVIRVTDGRTEKVGYSFYRGDSMQFAPKLADIARPNALRDYLLKGWMPEQPFIDADTNIIAFGSCFALNISNYLNNIGYNVATKKDAVAYVSSMGDGIVNTYALLQQFEWAWKNKTPQTDLWHGYKAKAFGYDEEVRLKTKDMFDAADVFIITLGLSEVWYDEPTGEVFWKAVPQRMFDPSRHKFRVSDYEESLDNLRKIHTIIREHRPDAKLVFTLSPIPLAATFRNQSCITANAVSKAILRAAIDRLYREKAPTDPNFFYFPSYEIVLQGFRNQFGSDGRHVYPHVLDVNMKAFERFFCKTGLTNEYIDDAFAQAVSIDQQLGHKHNGAILEELNQLRAEDFASDKVRNMSLARIVRAKKIDNASEDSDNAITVRDKIRAKRIADKRAKVRATRRIAKVSANTNP